MNLAERHFPGDPTAAYVSFHFERPTGQDDASDSSTQVPVLLVGLVSTDVHPHYITVKALMRILRRTHFVYCLVSQPSAEML